MNKTWNTLLIDPFVIKKFGLEGILKNKSALN